MSKSKKKQKVKKEIEIKPKAGDFENVVDGSVLIATGLVKLLGFAISTLIDGVKWIFEKEPKKPDKFVHISAKKRT